MDCPICLIRFDSKERTPRNIGCGHTVCEECLKNLIDRNMQNCPICRKVLEKRKAISTYPKSYALMELIEQKKNEVEKSSLICSDCRISECKVCSQQMRSNDISTRKANIVKMTRVASKVPLEENYDPFEEITKARSLISHNIGSIARHVEFSKERAKNASQVKEGKIEKCIKYFDRIINHVTNKKNETLQLIENEFTSFIELSLENANSGSKDLEELKIIKAKLTALERDMLNPLSADLPVSTLTSLTSCNRNTTLPTDTTTAADSQNPRFQLEPTPSEVLGYHNAVCGLVSSLNSLVHRHLNIVHPDLPNIIYRSDANNVVHGVSEKIDVYVLGKRYGERFA